MSKKKQKKKKKKPVKVKQSKKKKTRDKEENRPFTNDFVFSLVMRDPDVCKGIRKLILPDEEIGDVKTALSDDYWSDLIKKPEVVPQASLENGLVPINSGTLTLADGFSVFFPQSYLQLGDCI